MGLDGFDTLRYEVGDTGVATITLDQPDNRNALSTELLDDLLAALTLAREDAGVRCVVLTSSHDRVFSSGANLAGFAAEVPLVHKHFGTDRFPAPVPADRRARQADPVRGQRPRAGGRAGHRARLRPDRRQGGRRVRDARDQRRGLPVHDHGADLPQRPAQEDERAAAAGRADLARRRPSGSGSSTRSCRPTSSTTRWRAGRRSSPSKSPVIMRLGKDAMFRQLDMAFADALDYLHAQLTLAVSTEDIVEGVTRLLREARAALEGPLSRRRRTASSASAAAPATAARRSLRGVDALAPPARPSGSAPRRAWSARPSGRGPATTPRTSRPRAAACSRPAARWTTRWPPARSRCSSPAECPIALTTLPAVGRHRPDARILWLDAHGDFNTPDTTPERLSRRHVPGRRLRALGPGPRAAAGPGERVVLCGVRDLDPAEREALERSAATVHRRRDRDARVPGNALDGAPVYLHLDLDVLDPTRDARRSSPSPAAEPGEALRPARRRRRRLRGRRHRGHRLRGARSSAPMAASRRPACSTRGSTPRRRSRHGRTTRMAAADTRVARRCCARSSRTCTSGASRRKLGGGEEKIAAQHARGQADRARAARLLIDEGTFVELGIHGRPHFSQRAMEGKEAPADGVDHRLRQGRRAAGRGLRLRLHGHGRLDGHDRRAEGRRACASSR